MVFFLNVAAIFIFIVLLVKVRPKATATTVFVDVINDTGWSSDGLVFFLAHLPGMLAVCLFDASAHLSEEVPRPDRNVLLVMIAVSILNALGGLVALLITVFCTTHPESLLDPIAGLPIFQGFWDARPNIGWLIVCSLIYIAMTVNGIISFVTGCGRLLWTFASSGGLPPRNWHSVVSTKHVVPTNAIIVSCVLPAFFSLYSLARQQFLTDFLALLAAA